MQDKQRIRDDKRKIRKVFLEEWDPIGIGDDPNAQDEYDGYLGVVHGLLKRRASAGEIVDDLYWVEEALMGMRPMEKTRLLFVADRLQKLGLGVHSAEEKP